jgi:hypothetical protein
MYLACTIVELTTLLVVSSTTVGRPVGLEGLTTYAVASFTRVGVGWRHASRGWSKADVLSTGWAVLWRRCRAGVVSRYAVAGSGEAKTLTVVASRSSRGTTIDSGRAGELEGRWPRRRSWLQTT